MLLATSLVVSSFTENICSCGMQLHVYHNNVFDVSITKRLSRGTGCIKICYVMLVRVLYTMNFNLLHSKQTDLTTFIRSFCFISRISLLKLKICIQPNCDQFNLFFVEIFRFIGFLFLNKRNILMVERNVTFCNQFYWIARAENSPLLIFVSFCCYFYSF